MSGGTSAFLPPALRTCSSRRWTPSSIAPCSARTRPLASPPLSELFLHGQLALGEPAGLRQRLIQRGDHLLPPFLLHLLPLLAQLVAQRLERLARPARPVLRLRTLARAGSPRRPAASAARPVEPGCRTPAASPSADRSSTWLPRRPIAVDSESARVASSRSVRAARALSADSARAFHSCCSWASSLDSLLRLARSPSSAARLNSSLLRSSASRSSCWASASRSSASFVRSASRSLSACCSSCSRSRSSGDSARSSWSRISSSCRCHAVSPRPAASALFLQRLQRLLERLRLLQELLLGLRHALGLLGLLEGERVAAPLATAIGVARLLLRQVLGLPLELPAPGRERVEPPATAAVASRCAARTSLMVGRRSTYSRDRPICRWGVLSTAMAR